MDNQRHQIILNELDKKGNVTVASLVELTGASESSIRRDLVELDHQGFLKRVHGGATLIPKVTQTIEDPLGKRQLLNADEKKKIAKYAASLIKENDVVSTAIEPQQIKEKEKDVPEAEKIVDILNMFQYFNGDTKEPCFCIYSNKFQVIKKDFILNDLLSYYEYLSKFKKLFDIDINSLTNTEFDALENVLSDFLEVSKRFGSCVYDLKQYLKEKKKELNKNG